MLDPGGVLILTHPDDMHAAAVEPHLVARGVKVWRFDTADLSTAGLGTDVALVAQLGQAGFRGVLGGCDLTKVRCVWHRRPSDFVGTSTDNAAELRAGVGGVLAALPYLNHPADMALAGMKPYQLTVATRAGLRVPETVIATTSGPALSLAARHNEAVVVKPMSRQLGGIVNTDRAGWSRAIHLTQQRIDKVADVRLTVIDTQLYAVQITSPHFDWRADLNSCSYEAVRVPTATAWGVRATMRALRLRFAAMDFVVDAENQWWFLEVNPNGQWLWIEEATGLPLAATVAGALSGPVARSGGGTPPILIP